MCASPRMLEAARSPGVGLLVVNFLYTRGVRFYLLIFKIFVIQVPEFIFERPFQSQILLLVIVLQQFFKSYSQLLKISESSWCNSFQIIRISNINIACINYLFLKPNFCQCNLFFFLNYLFLTSLICFYS